MNYAETLAAIQSLAPRGWRLGLDRMEEFVKRAELGDALGSGQPSYIHIAGTNGKGSVTAYVQSILISAGYRTGAFYSPFVVDPRERWQFGRDMIASEDLAETATELWPVGESLAATEFGGITEFEFKTGLAFLYYKRKKCDWVALEVGLGGRLDATNVITPKACAIVSIGLDHVNVLGNSLEEIAEEKAGIIKEGIPVVLGALPGPALTTTLEIARSRRAPVWQVGGEIHFEVGPQGVSIATPAGRYTNLRLGLQGTPQPHNAAVAVAAIAAAGIPLSLESVSDGLTKASLPGRFQSLRVNGKTWILDGAHNAPAAFELRQSLLEAGFRGVTLLSGMVAGHEPAAFYAPLNDLVSEAFFTPIDFHRGLPAADVAAASGVTSAHACSSVREAVSRASESAGDIVLVTGSFYLIGEVWPILQKQRDSLP